MVGRAYPVVCDVDFLDVLKALSEAGEGEASRDGGHRRGRPRPRRRHDRGDGCSGLRAGGDAPSRDHPGDRGAVRAACVGGVVAGRRDLLFGDADGVVIPADAIGEILPVAEGIQRTEGASLEAPRRGRSFFEHTNLEEHHQRRADGLPSTLGLSPPHAP